MKVRKPTIVFSSLILTVYYFRNTGFASTQIENSLGRELQQLKIQDAIKRCRDIDLDNPVSKKERDRAKAFRTSLVKFRGDDKSIKDYVDSNEAFDDFIEVHIKSLTPDVAAWIVFFAFSILATLCYTSNWCCMYGLCKDECKYRYRCCNVPKKKRDVTDFS